MGARGWNLVRRTPGQLEQEGRRHGPGRRRLHAGANPLGLLDVFADPELFR